NEQKIAAQEAADKAVHEVKAKKEISYTFEQYKKYANASNGAMAVRHLDSTSSLYFQKIADLSKNADSAKIARLSFMECLLVLMTRTGASKEQVLGFDGGKLLKFAIDNGFI